MLMARFFDIMPPKPKKATPAKKKNNNTLGFFLVLLIIGIIGFIAFSNLPQTGPQNQGNPVPSANTDNNFNLFGQPTPSVMETITPKTTNIRVRIINASGRPEATDQAKNLLINASMAVEQATEAETSFTQSIIYYRNGSKEQAEIIQKILSNSFLARTEESQTIGQTNDNSDLYDVLLIIGQK